MSELLPHLADANLYHLIVEPHKEGSFFHPAVMQQINADVVQRRNKLAAVEHDESGLDVARVHRFLERYGLMPKPFVAVGEFEAAVISDILQVPYNENVAGSYDAITDFSYVVRGRFENAGGRETLEATAVHEGSHANQGLRDYFYTKKIPAGNPTYFQARSGHRVLFARQVRGSYFEEAFASTMEHRYVLEELEQTNGLADTDAPMELDVMTAPKGSYFLPGSYLLNDVPPNSEYWATGGHAAFGLQLMNAEDPAIFPAMLEARRNVEGLREFASRVNSLSPGLYGFLNQVPYEESFFRIGTHEIIKRLYDGDAEQAVWTSMEQDSQALIAA